MNVNITADKLNAKISSWAKTKRGKEIINEAVADAVKNEGAERERMIKVANMFIQVLKDTASRRIGFTESNQSIQEHFNSLKASEPSIVMRNGKAYGVVYIYFSSEDDLSRNSLLLPNGNRTGDGINNIVALFNNGYELKSKITPRGVWGGHNNGKEIRAKRKRDELGFMQSAASLIKRTYKDVDAIILSDEYN